MQKKREILLGILRLALLSLAAVLIILGIDRGEPELIFQKAVRMCLECMGIG